MNFTVLLLVNSAHVKESICQLAIAHKCRQHFLQLARLNDRHSCMCVCVCVPWFLKRQLTVLTGPQRSHIHKDTPAQRCLGCATKLPASVQHFDIVGLWLCVSAQECVCVLGECISLCVASWGTCSAASQGLIQSQTARTMRTNKQKLNIASHCRPSPALPLPLIMQLYCIMTAGAHLKLCRDSFSAYASLKTVNKNPQQ